MAIITQVKDRTTGSCSGMSLAAIEVLASTDQREHEYRVREFAYKGVWQLQEVKQGATGMHDADYQDIGEFASKQDALAYIEQIQDE